MAEELARTMSQYGLWGIVAVLCLAVGYLFRLVVSLQKEMRDTIQQNLRDTLSVVESAKHVMEQTAEAVREQKATTDILKELIRIMSLRPQGGGR